jgi:hypothetical protein
MSGIEEDLIPQALSTKPEPTIVRGGLLFEPADGEGRMAAGSLLDISGRKVLDLYPGANDVRNLAPGVYFVMSVGGEHPASSCSKVVVAR